METSTAASTGTRCWPLMRFPTEFDWVHARGVDAQSGEVRILHGIILSHGWRPAFAGEPVPVAVRPTVAAGSGVQHGETGHAVWGVESQP